MLVEFSIENFLSFNERVTLSLVAAPDLDDPDKLIENTFEAPGGIRLLKSALVYGANASGKSNLIKAVLFARKLVLDSAKDTQAGEPIKVMLGFTLAQIRAGTWTEEILQLAREADLGITGISATDLTAEMLPEKLSKDARERFLSGPFGTLTVRHQTFNSAGQPEGDVEFNLDSESEGTQKFIALTGPLLDVLKTGVAFFLDELDARLHPRLTRAIVRPSLPLRRQRQPRPAHRCHPRYQSTRSALGPP